MRDADADAVAGADVRVADGCEMSERRDRRTEVVDDAVLSSQFASPRLFHVYPFATRRVCTAPPIFTRRPDSGLITVCGIFGVRDCLVFSELLNVWKLGRKQTG